MSSNTTTTGLHSPQARLLYDSRATVVASTNNVHAVLYSSKFPDHQQISLPVPRDCAEVDENDDKDVGPNWRLAQPQPVDDDVQYYVIDRRKLLASGVGLKTASKQTSPGEDENFKQLCLREGGLSRNSGSLAGQSLAGECRPLLVAPPGECCRSQRYAQVPTSSAANVENSNDSAS